MSMISEWTPMLSKEAAADHEASGGILFNDPVHLDIEYYSKLWNPNDLWRLYVASFNLNVHIDYIYDMAVRLVRNVLTLREKYGDLWPWPDAPKGFIPPITMKELAHLAGWPYDREYFAIVGVFSKCPIHGWGVYPTDGFIEGSMATASMLEWARKNYPGKTEGKVPCPPFFAAIDLKELYETGRCDCNVIANIKDWEHYIANGDSQIGQGKWTNVVIESGPRTTEPATFEIGVRVKEMCSDMERLGLGISTFGDPNKPDLAMPFGILPPDLTQGLMNLKKNERTWKETLSDWNKKQAETKASRPTSNESSNDRLMKLEKAFREKQDLKKKVKEEMYKEHTFIDDKGQEHTYKYIGTTLSSNRQTPICF